MAHFFSVSHASSCYHLYLNSHKHLLSFFSVTCKLLYPVDCPVVENVPRATKHRHWRLLLLNMLNSQSQLKWYEKIAVKDLLQTQTFFAVLMLLLHSIRPVRPHLQFLIRTTTWWQHKKPADFQDTWSTRQHPSLQLRRVSYSQWQFLIIFLLYTRYITVF